MNSMILALYGMFQSIAGGDPTIVTVDAQSFVESNPDMATISFDLRGEGATSNDAAQALVDSEKRIYASLAAQSHSIEIEDDEFQIRALHSPECANPSSEIGYEDEVVSFIDGDCAITGHIASKSVIVRTPTIDDAGTLASLASREGALNAEVASFGLMDSRPAKKEAIALALTEARSKAEAIAAASGRSIGAVISVSLDGAGYERGVQELRVNIQEFVGLVPNRNLVEVEMRPAPIKTNARVTVVYSLVE